MRFLIVFLIGCNAAPLATPVAARDLFRGYAERGCRLRAQCCGITVDEAACVQRSLEQSRTLIDGIERSVAAGTIVLDQPRATRCLARPQPACDDPIAAHPDPCFFGAIIRGVVPLGGACDDVHPDACAPGLSCFESACRPRARAGSACNFDDGCEEPLLCVSSRCTAALPTGAACTETDECASWSCGMPGGCSPSPTEGSLACL